MNSRFNYEPVKKRDSSEDDVFYKWEYKKRIKVLSTNKDGSVGDYVEENFWDKEKCSWSDFINSYDTRSIQEQVMDHLTKGTPLTTAHTLPSADYTQLEKGAEIKREMTEKGITIEMLVQALKEANVVQSVKEEVKSEVKE